MKIKLLSFLLTLTAVAPSYTSEEQPQPQQKKYVVVGTRNLARCVTLRLASEGKKVVVLAWNNKKTAGNYKQFKNVEVVKCAIESDAHVVASVTKDAHAIFFAPHYPYAIWAQNMIKAARNVIAGAEQNKATILFASKAYVLGDSTKPYTEKSLPQPCSDQGKIFFEIENLLCHSAQQGKCKAIILRHAHAFGPHIIDGLMDRAFRNANAGQAMQWINRTDMDYQVAYSLDIADTLVRLADRKLAPSFSIFHQAGSTINVDEWLKQITTTAGNKEYTTNLDGKFKVRMLAPFQTDAQACKDIFYSFENSITMKSTLLEKTLGDVAQTPMTKAIKDTLLFYKASQD